MTQPIFYFYGNFIAPHDERPKPFVPQILADSGGMRRMLRIQSVIAIRGAAIACD